MESPAQLQPLFLWAAFWIVVLRCSPGRSGATGQRVPIGNEAVAVARAQYARDTRWEAALGLMLGVALSHGVWSLLHAGSPSAALARALDPSSGFTLLAVPLGPILLGGFAQLRACGARRERARAQRRSDAVLLALPLGFAVARAGCVVAGCCAGIARTWPPGLFVLPRVPMAALEIAGWSCCAALLPRVPARLRAPAFCMAFGGLRLLLEPLRASASDTGAVPAPLLAPAWLAAAWLAGGAAWWCARRAPPGSDRAPQSSPAS